jgi:hypothetical protein
MDAVYCPGCRETLVGRPVLPLGTDHDVVVLRHLDENGDPLPEQSGRRVKTQMSLTTYRSQGGV